MKHPEGCQKEEVLRTRDVHGGERAELRGILLFICAVQNKGRVGNKFLSYDLAREKDRGEIERFPNKHIGLAQLPCSSTCCLPKTFKVNSSPAIDRDSTRLFL